MASTQKAITGYQGDILIKGGIVYGPAGLAAGGFDVVEWIVCGAGATIAILEEYRNGISTDVLAEHGFSAGQVLPTGYILKSSTGNGFSKLQIFNADSQGYRLSPVVYAHTRNSVNSGINEPD